MRMAKGLLARATGQPGRRAGYDDDMDTGSVASETPSHRSDDYSLWSVIADRVRRDGLRRVFEVGCGPSRLVADLFDRGVEAYAGIDRSPTAVAPAWEAVMTLRSPRGTTDRFLVFDGSRNGRRAVGAR